MSDTEPPVASAPATVPSPELRSKPIVKVIGVGTAGIATMEELIRGGMAGASFVAVITEARAATQTSASEKIHLETRLLRGLGTGGDPERGKTVAEEHFSKLRSLCDGAEVVFIIAGLGGGAGTGIAPVIAKAAKECGALALGFVILPFECEGHRRQRLALAGLEELKSAADGLIALRNQSLFKLIDENASIQDTFKFANQLLADGIRGIYRLIAEPGLIQIHFTDLSELVRDRHCESSFAVVEGIGPTRSREVVDKLLAHPLLDEGRVLEYAEAVLISIVGSPDLSMAEVNRVVQGIGTHCEEAQVVTGAAIDNSLQDTLSVTLIVSRRVSEDSKPAPSQCGEEIDEQLLPNGGAPRHPSRFVPPPPTLNLDQVRQMAARQGAMARGRKNSQRMRQAQLPLEMISKGRFEKSEPTIHRGEDLDVPTYVRRRIALN